MHEFAILVEFRISHCQETRNSSWLRRILEIFNFTHETISTLRRLTKTPWRSALPVPRRITSMPNGQDKMSGLLQLA